MTTWTKRRPHTVTTCTDDGASDAGSVDSENCDRVDWCDTRQDASRRARIASELSSAVPQVTGQHNDAPTIDDYNAAQMLSGAMTESGHACVQPDAEELD